LFNAGLKAGIFRKGKKSPAKGNRKARAIAPATLLKHENFLVDAMKSRDAIKFALAMNTELGEDSLYFLEEVVAHIEHIRA
jgi:hypothetical protein